jgi:hypothetical protein
MKEQYLYVLDSFEYQGSQKLSDAFKNEKIELVLKSTESLARLCCVPG